MNVTDFTSHKHSFENMFGHRGCNASVNIMGRKEDVQKKKKKLWSGEWKNKKRGKGGKIRIVVVLNELWLSSIAPSPFTPL